jgi:hypothetical protein
VEEESLLLSLNRNNFAITKIIKREDREERISISCQERQELINVSSCKKRLSFALLSQSIFHA